MLTRDFIFEALYSPTSGYFGTKGSEVQKHRCMYGICQWPVPRSLDIQRMFVQVIFSPPEDQRIPFKTLKGYWDYQLALDK